jgi:DNA invertase Pin-like site-specific DNA recombinase
MAGKRAFHKADWSRVLGQGSRRTKTPWRAGLYARVSTQDQQTLPLQTRAMRQYAVRRGWTIIMQVKEIRSGASERELRGKLLEAARRREIDVVLVWRLDRWGRSLADLVATLQELERLGRPRTAAWKAGQVRELYRAGVSKAEIARRLKIGRTSVRRILKARIRP